MTWRKSACPNWYLLRVSQLDMTWLIAYVGENCGETVILYLWLEMCTLEQSYEDDSDEAVLGKGRSEVLMLFWTSESWQVQQRYKASFLNQ